MCGIEVAGRYGIEVTGAPELRRALIVVVLRVGVALGLGVSEEQSVRRLATPRP